MNLHEVKCMLDFVVAGPGDDEQSELAGVTHFGPIDHNVAICPALHQLRKHQVPPQDPERAQ